MNAGYVSDAVAAGLLLQVTLWLARRMAAAVNREQAKRCGPAVMAFYLLMAAHFVMGLGMVSFGVYCVLGNIPIPWLPRTIYGAIVAAIGLPGLFQAADVLRRDPSPVDWEKELGRLRTGLRYRLELGVAADKGKH